MTDKTVDILLNELKNSPIYRDRTVDSLLSSPSLFSRRIRSSGDWVRMSRSRSIKGWIRIYYSKQFPDRSVTLDVNSNYEDTHIEYVTVRVGGKIIGGGKVKVPSVLVSQRGRKAGLDLELTFVPFTEEQLAEIQAEMEHGESAVHTLLFEDRYV